MKADSGFRAGFAGRPGNGDEVELEGFEVEAERVVLDKVGATVTNVKLTFELARAGENGALLAAVASWSRTGGFRVGPKGCVPLVPLSSVVSSALLQEG